MDHPTRPSARASRPVLRIGALVGVVLVVGGCSSQTHYPYDWSIFVNSLIRPGPRIIGGLELTVIIAVISQVIGVILGVFAAIGRLSRSRLIRLIAGFYIWVFRGTPLLVQLTFVFFGLSATGIYSWPPIDVAGLHVPGEIQAGIFALGVNEGAYMAEIVRAGILSIDPGQMEAAKSLGMTYSLGMRRIILPQAARVIVPPLGNEFNNMLKTTSLLVVLSVTELYVTFEQLNASGPTVFHPFELFLACAVWFLLLTTIWGFIQGRIERRLAAGTAGSASGGTRRPGMMTRMLGSRNAGANPISGGR